MIWKCPNKFFWALSGSCSYYSCTFPGFLNFPHIFLWEKSISKDQFFIFVKYLLSFWNSQCCKKYMSHYLAKSVKYLSFFTQFRPILVKIQEICREMCNSSSHLPDNRNCPIAVKHSQYSIQKTHKFYIFSEPSDADTIYWFTFLACLNQAFGCNTNDNVLLQSSPKGVAINWKKIHSVEFSLFFYYTDFTWNQLWGI